MVQKSTVKSARSPEVEVGGHGGEAVGGLSPCGAVLARRALLRTLSGVIVAPTPWLKRSIVLESQKAGKEWVGGNVGTIAVRPKDVHPRTPRYGVVGCEVGAGEGPTSLAQEGCAPASR